VIFNAPNICNCFLFCSCSTFSPGDCFVGYQSDTAASIVFKVAKDLQSATNNDDGKWNELVSPCNMHVSMKISQAVVYCVAQKA